MLEIPNYEDIDSISWIFKIQRNLTTTTKNLNSFIFKKVEPNPKTFMWFAEYIFSTSCQTRTQLIIFPIIPVTKDTGDIEIL